MDVDGTLIRWVYYDYWVRFCVEYGLFPKYILLELDRILSEYKQRELSAPFLKYLSALVRCVRYDGVLAGVREEQMEAVCEEMARQKHGDVHVFTRELIRIAHEAGYKIALVSGSPTVALNHLAKYFPGIDRCFGTILPSENGRYTGSIDDSIVNNKKTTVLHYAKERNIDLTQSIAIGDSANDACMFACVGFPIGLNPTTELFRAGCHPERPFPLVFEKKMILSLKPRRDQSGYVTCPPHQILPSDIGISMQDTLKELDFL